MSKHVTKFINIVEIVVRLSVSIIDFSVLYGQVFAHDLRKVYPFFGIDWIRSFILDYNVTPKAWRIANPLNTLATVLGIYYDSTSFLGFVNYYLRRILLISK